MKRDDDVKNTQMRRPRHVDACTAADILHATPVPSSLSISPVQYT
jgi:hypothetical protein